MAKDTFTTLLRDGKTAADLLQSVPENKRILLRALADAYMSGMIDHERLTANQTVAKPDSA